MSDLDTDLSEVWKRRTFRFSVLLCLMALLTTVGLIIAYRMGVQRRIEDVKQRANARADIIAHAVAEHLSQIVPHVEELAGELSSRELAVDALQQRLQEIFETNQEDMRLLEVGVAYDPRFSPLSPNQAHAPHYGLIEKEFDSFDVQDMYNYQESAWYTETRDNGPHWIEPYFGKATQRWAAGYAVPFSRTAGSGKRTFAGVVRINFDLEKLRDIIIKEIQSADQTLRTGYTFLLSKQNRIIAHPITSYVGQPISELGKRDGTLQVIADKLTDKDGMVGDRVVDSMTGESYWILEKDVDLTDWNTAVVINTRETQDPANLVRFYQHSITACLVVFLCGVCFFLLRVSRGSEKTLWYYSIVCSALLATGTVVIWVFAVTGQPHGNDNGVYIVDSPTAEATVVRHLMRLHDSSDTGIRIPTGVFVQSLTFTSSNNVRLTGYLWQKKKSFSGNDLDKELLGFIFPEAEEISEEIAYENDQVIGWYFETTLRQQFDYSRYPFDREDVWIRLWPESMNPNVILVPDFESYHERKIDGIPGVEKDLVLEGWTIKNSYFSYRTNSYNVDFGQMGFDPEHSLELYFNLGLRRNFVSPFVADMIPIIVIAFLSFAVLMCATRHPDQAALYGFSTSSVLGYCAALFFVLIVSHVQLRNTLVSHGIIYMEYFYFVMYLVILAVSTDSLMFASSESFAFIHYNDNIIVKQLFWPLLTGLLFVITLLVFR